MKLEGKKILITGGSSGMGLELARRLAAANEVVIAARDEAKLNRAVAQTQALRALRLDVGSEQQAGEAVAWVARELGGLDLLVNCAGVIKPSPLAGPDADARARSEVEVNLLGSLRMTRLALPLLEASAEGAVVFVSSAVALVAVPGNAVYAATKAGVHSLARSLRAELKDKHVRVHEVLAPVVDTDFVSGLDVKKIPVEDAVDAIVAGLEHDRDEIRVQRVRQLALIARLAPTLADRIVLRALTSAG
jgi:uncharacterized oxidoreductase